MDVDHATEITTTNLSKLTNPLFVVTKLRGNGFQDLKHFSPKEKSVSDGQDAPPQHFVRKSDPCEILLGVFNHINEGGQLLIVTYTNKLEADKDSLQVKNQQRWNRRRR